MRKILIAPLLVSSLVLAALTFVQGPTPARADEQAARDKYRGMKVDLDQFQRDYDKYCVNAQKREAFAQELKAKNEIVSEKGITKSWAGNFGRAEARIECGTWNTGGDELFRCQANAQCTKRAKALIEKRERLARQPNPPLPRSRQDDEIPRPEAPLPHQTVAETVITVSAPRTGQRPVTHPSDSACGIPSTMEIKGNKAHAVLGYRRNRMFKQALYDLCIARGVSDQDRLACASVVKPMSMSDISANSAYMKSHASASELLVCLKQRTEKSSEPNAAILSKAESECLGSDHPDVLQAAYMADLPDCQLAHAVRDTTSAPVKNSETESAPDASKAASAGGAHSSN